MRMISREELENMSDSDLHNLSLQKNAKGHYTYDADLAYIERRRRNGGLHYGNAARKCSKYQADLDYYGSYVL